MGSNMAVVSLFRGSNMAAVTLGETKNKTMFRAAVDKSYHIGQILSQIYAKLQPSNFDRLLPSSNEGKYLKAISVFKCFFRCLKSSLFLKFYNNGK